jgi:hypothetical protein
MATQDSVDRLVVATERIADVVERMDAIADITRIYDDWYNRRDTALERPPIVVLEEIGTALYGRVRPPVRLPKHQGR